MSHPRLTPSSLPCAPTWRNHLRAHISAREHLLKEGGAIVPGTAPFVKKKNLNQGSQAIPVNKTEAAWTVLRPALLFKAVTLEV